MNKVMHLREAVEQYIHDGDHLAFGGFTTNRKPMAAVSEIIRQGKGSFIAEGGPAGSEWDMLIGAGRVRAYINCYTANPRFSNIGRRFRAAIEAGKLLFEDYSQDAAMMLFHAASLGLPYLPSRYMFGSGMEDIWGISREEREKIDKLPNEKYIVRENPFDPGEQLLLLPVPKIEAAVIHVQVASEDGTCRIFGDEYHDADIAVAAERVIVTCEELVGNEEIRRDAERNSIPGFLVNAVVHLPHGAHPTQCSAYYDYDKDFLRMYDEAGRTDEGFADFLREWVYGVKDHAEYLDRLGASRMIGLRVTPGTGYVK
ncbi:MAG: glutaconate CoA-transferase [Clostridiales Family XIII bacterium]|nr:glutaconate CoA-transferase [Clostridiales Family XIII bacterium]